MISEYFNGKKKAIVSKKDANVQGNLWEVSMYIDDRIVQKTVARTEEHAEIIAEDFINADTFVSPTLLNENLNG